MITIHWDFSDGTEVPYTQGKLLGDNFTTHCLDFFNMDERVDDVIVLRSDGKKISRKNIQAHSFKEIRKSHNIHKMLVAGSFNWLTSAVNNKLAQIAAEMANVGDSLVGVELINRIEQWQPMK